VSGRLGGRATRIASIVRADFLIRFRKASTLVVFLLISFSAYPWMPDPATGRALLKVEGHRALYDSAAIGMGTAALGTILVGLLGFYVVSNALGRDLGTRCGFVIASTRMKSSEYLLGKALGNMVFLSTFMAGYMAVSMAMVLVRGEAPLEPLVFVRQYALLAPPTIVLVATVAVLFESVRWLSGRLGDVAWFFLWMGGMAAPAVVLGSEGRPGLVRYLDFSGLGFLISRMRETLGTTAISIGASSFDPAKEVVVLEGLTLPPEWIAPRLVATLLPLTLLPVALVFFHRFDPAKVRQRSARARSGWLAGIDRLLKPLIRPFGILRIRSRRAGGPSLWRAAREDAYVTLTGAPALAATIPVVALFALFLPLGALRSGLLPAAFVALALLVADVPSRERRNGLVGMVYAAPGLRSGFVSWKLLTTLVIALMVVAIPLIRLALADPVAAVSLLSGTLFTCATAVALGVASSNPKTFLALFLVFWYVVVNDGGGAPMLDFAGFYGVATAPIMAAYLALAAGLLAAAQGFHRLALRD
jgi:hypothetical protein